MNEYTSVITVKIDIHSLGINAKDAERFNKELCKNYLAQMMQDPSIDGCNIIKATTTETKKCS